MLLNCKLLLFSTVIFYNPEGLKSGEWTLPLGQIPRQNPLDKSPDQDKFPLRKNPNLKNLNRFIKTGDFQAKHSKTCVIYTITNECSNLLTVAICSLSKNKYCDSERDH